MVVVGGGAAGAAAVATLRDEGYDGPVTIVSAERTPPVDRPNLSKDYLAGTAQEEWIPLKDDAWYAERDIALRTGRRATGIDVEARTLRLDDGTSLGFDALLLATGASPVQLKLGDDARVHYLRTWDDSRAIIARAATARRRSRRARACSASRWAPRSASCTSRAACASGSGARRAAPTRRA